MMRSGFIVFLFFGVAVLQNFKDVGLLRLQIVYGSSKLSGSHQDLSTVTKEDRHTEKEGNAQNNNRSSSIMDTTTGKAMHHQEAMAYTTDDGNILEISEMGRDGQKRHHDGNSEGGRGGGQLGGCDWKPLRKDASGRDASYSNTTCMKIITERVLASYEMRDLDPKKAVPPLRWLFFGDSTMYFLKGHLYQTLTRSGKRIQKACPSALMCDERQHKRCHLNKAFRLENPSFWRAPNFTLGEGPMGRGLKDAGCQDCNTCQSMYTICNRVKNNENCVLKSRELYGGYLSVEFARDVEIQTSKYGTSQENVLAFVQENYNSDPWILEQFGGLPVCVVGAGLHDMSIPKVTLASFIVNVEWYLGLLLENCGHIVWLQNTATLRKDDQDDSSNWPQTQAKVYEWNQAVYHQMKASQTLPLQRLTVMDVFDASINHPHKDNIHMDKSWYNDLGAFFLQLAQTIRKGPLPL